MGAVPHRKMRRLRNSAFRRSAFLFRHCEERLRRSNPELCAADPGLLRRFAPRNDEVYPCMIVMAAGPTIGAV